MRIMDTKFRDMRLFHQLVKEHNSKGNVLIDDLNVLGNVYSGEDVLEEFRTHFQKLATRDQETHLDPHYHAQSQLEAQIIDQLVRNKSRLQLIR